MTVPALFVENRPLRLGHRVGKGGEGEVYALGDDNSLAVKVYTTPDRRSREAKIVAMVGEQLANQAPLVAFPLSVVRTRDGAFAGFLMKLVSDHKALHDLYAPGSRKHHFPHADYRFIVRAATNIARAIASVHRAGCVIGDINHSGILVSQKAIVTLIDADSFQVTKGTNRFLCRVGVPEYTPPELQGMSLANVLRTPNHDAFGLAVVIFQLLFMGRHPFVGTVRRGDIPPLHEAIKNYSFAYAEGRDVGMDQPPGTPALSDFSPPIASAFETAFSREANEKRPSAENWVTLLHDLEKSLAQCAANQLHYAPREASECPWCDMESQLGTFLFLPYVPGVGLTTTSFDPGASGFNLDVVWARIAAVAIPTRGQLTPRLRTSTTSPSEEAKAARDAVSNPWVWRGWVIGIAIVLFIAVPKMAIFWLGLAIWGMVGGNSNSTLNGEPFRRKYFEAEETGVRELINWYRRCGLEDIEKLKNELQEARDAYKSLGAWERAQIESYQSQRHSRHLQAFLDGFDIQHAKIKGVGPAKEAVLASYGIDTAADVTLQKLLKVPGFGPTNTQGLLKWRAKLESRFVYRTNPNDTDTQEIARIRATVEGKASALRRQLLSGSENLRRLVNRTLAAVTVEDPLLNRLEQNLAQAKCDLEFLQLPIPSARTQPSAGTTTTSGRNPTVLGSSQPCPRCGATMVRRVARRGRFSGRQFWGCSRYPACKGTRN